MSGLPWLMGATGPGRLPRPAVTFLAMPTYVTRPCGLVTVRAGTCGLGVHGASIAVNAILFHFRASLGGGILPDP
jgi:hypothetical protein